MQVAKHKPNLAWTQLLQSLFPRTIQELTDINLAAKDIRNLVPDNIIQDIMIAWSHINYRISTSQQDILDQYIWFNSHISVNNDVIFFESWCKLGINKVQHILKDGKFKTCTQMWVEYGQKVNFLDLYKVQKAIPKEWLKCIQNSIETSTQKSANQLLTDNVKCSNLVYNLVISRYFDDSINRSTWECDLNCKITDSNWEQQFEIIKKLTLSTKLRFFHYRVLHRYLITNVKLAQWNKGSLLCTFCEQFPETIMQLFVECIYVQKIWKAIIRWMYCFCFIEVEFTQYEIILNGYKGAFVQLVNTICLIIKYHIYVQKCLNRKLCFQEVIRSITKYKIIEQKSSRKLGIKAKMDNKWLMYDM